MLVQESQFHTSFCSNARALAVKYEIPLLHCFENQGTDKDVQILIEKVREIDSPKLINKTQEVYILH